jgi:hypothetical protein
VNVLTIGSQVTQKKGDEQRQARYFALNLDKHEDHGHVIANDMWQMLLKLYINSTKKWWVFLHKHRMATAEHISALFSLSKLTVWLVSFWGLKLPTYCLILFTVCSTSDGSSGAAGTKGPEKKVFH